MVNALVVFAQVVAFFYYLILNIYTINVLNIKKL